MIATPRRTAPTAFLKAFFSKGFKIETVLIYLATAINIKNMTGQELRQLLLNKWGFSYDIQLRRTQGKIFVQIMWKYLEQASFPLSEKQYLTHLDEIASYLDALGGAEQVQEYIQETRDRPRLGKAVSIALDLGERSSEWLI